MKLHENEELFRDAITATAQQINLPEIYIEKDYWVTLALHHIFHSEIAAEAVFKGGTALSKCFKIIERFSEDIDIVVLRKEGENDNDLKRKIKKITGTVDGVVPEIFVEGLTRKMGMNRKTVHAYPKKAAAGEYGQVREHIVVEATWLGNTEPYTTAEVSSFITGMMNAQGQTQLAKEYQMLAFPVNVLTKERTLCEKIMSLVRFSNTEEPYQDLAKKIRHIYDIHMLLRDQETATFFDSTAFDQLLLLVGHDDIQSFKNNNQWLNKHPVEALIFTDAEATWEQIRSPYRTSFRELVTGELPEEERMIQTLKQVAARLKTVGWEIRTPQ